MDTQRQTSENLAMLLEDSDNLNETLIRLIKQHIRLKIQQRLERFSNSRDRCESLYKSFVQGQEVCELREENECRLERAYTEDCINVRKVCKF